MALQSPIPRGQPLRLDCMSCPTRFSSEWAVLNDVDMAEVNEAKITRRYHRGEYVFTNGQACTGLFCIAIGTTARRRAEPEVPPVLIRLVSAGETLGYRGVLEGPGCAGDAKVLEACVICHIELALMQRLLRRHRSLTQRFQARLAVELGEAEAELARVAWLPVRCRVARLIVGLAERNHTGNGEDGIELALPMNRRDMAELLCTRPETLSRALQAMESDGLLRSAGSRLAIPSLRRLRKEATTSPG